MPVEIYVYSAIIIVCLAITALCIAAINALQKSRQTLAQLGNSLEAAQRELSQLNSRLAPMLDDAHIVASKTREITETIRFQANALKNAASAANDIVQDVRNFERKILMRIDDPLAILRIYGRAAWKGVKVFYTIMRKD